MEMRSQTISTIGIGMQSLCAKFEMLKERSEEYTSLWTTAVTNSFYNHTRGLHLNKNNLNLRVWVDAFLDQYVTYIECN